MFATRERKKETDILTERHVPLKIATTLSTRLAASHSIISSSSHLLSCFFKCSSCIDWMMNSVNKMFKIVQIFYVPLQLVCTDGMQLNVAKQPRQAL